MKELVQLIDGARQEGYDTGGLGLCYILANYEHGGDPEELKHFSRVESDVYPQLAAHYRHVVKGWCDAECEKNGTDAVDDQETELK